MKLRTLTVLGCDGGYPGPRGAGSGYLVNVGDTTVLVDAGSGTFANLQVQCDPGTVDAVVLSHEHPDHWTDIEGFAVWLMQNGPGHPIPIYAPEGMVARSYFPDVDVFAWHEVAAGDSLAVGELTCRFLRTDHGPITLAVEITETGVADPGRSLVYSADTGPDWSVDEFAIGVGTFLCEATYTATREGTNRHLSGRQAGAMAQRCGVGRLICTHRSPTVSADELLAEVATTFSGRLEQAQIGAVFEW